MDLLIALLLFGVFYFVVLRDQTVSKEQEVDPCPPHEWYTQEIVDHEGFKQGERLVCRKCGPYSKLVDGSVE